ncbi:unnamed protein product [Enterobius vermicularis]|uniref:thioredoxin-disulfide reductase (NADPH) n=1 Tax=Enterobius vermicularis TaxID=51028 RepID=A0A3P6IYH9_ENTVE|nr:unnamed protein product [Enterobius vermicularis]
MQIDSIFSELGEELHKVEVNKAVANFVLYVVDRDTFPLVFIKGDCVGGLCELRLLEENGVLRNWLSKHTYDLIVCDFHWSFLGGFMAAKYGKKVACLDFVKPSTQGTTWGLGGTCVNVGCIPKKLMHRASILGEHINDAKKFGWEIDGEPKLDWCKMRNAVQDHVASLNWNYRVQLRENSVTYINAYGKFVDSHTLEAKNKKGKVEMLTADRFLLATGLRPRFPNVPGCLECCISSDDLFSLPYNPGKTLCVGASYISLESAGFLKGIGNDVTVMVRSIILRGFDRDMAERIQKHMLEIGVKFINAVPFKYEKIKEPSVDKPGLIRVYTINTLEDGSKQEVSEDFNTVLMAIGRDAVTDDVGLDEIGVERAPNKKIIGRHEQSKSCPYVYAVGDVLDGCLELTPVARTAGKVLMRRLYTGNCEMTEYDKVPTTVFTPLEYGSCGLSEETAKQRYGAENVNVYHGMFLPLEFTIPQRVENRHCYLKLICVKSQNDRVVGLHILSPDAGEITQGFAIALKLDATKADFDRLIGIHPTVAEVCSHLLLRKKRLHFTVLVLFGWSDESPGLFGII